MAGALCEEREGADEGRVYPCPPGCKVDEPGGNTHEGCGGNTHEGTSPDGEDDGRIVREAQDAMLYPDDNSGEPINWRGNLQKGTNTDLTTEERWQVARVLEGTHLEANLLKKVLDRLGIEKTRTTPYHPASDGMVESFSRTLERMFRDTLERPQGEWDVATSGAQYNPVRKPRQYKEGQWVWYFTPKKKRNVCPKLQTHWTGPWQITGLLNPTAVKIKRGARAKVVHVNLIKHCTGRAARKATTGESEVTEELVENEEEGPETGPAPILAAVGLIPRGRCTPVKTADRGKDQAGRLPNNHPTQ